MADQDPHGCFLVCWESSSYLLAGFPAFGYHTVLSCDGTVSHPAVACFSVYPLIIISKSIPLQQCLSHRSAAVPLPHAVLLHPDPDPLANL